MTKNIKMKRMVAFSFIFLLISMTFANAYSFVPDLKVIPTAEAAENGCCVKTNSGEYCIENAEDTKCSDSSMFYSGSSCSAKGVDGCEVGTCIEENGICSTYKTKQQCTDGKGFFTTASLSSVGECQPGCCIYKNEQDEIAFTEWKNFKKSCEISGKKYNLNYETTEDDAKTCAAMVPAETKGYCWMATSCSYGKKSDCPEEGVFNQNACPNCQKMDSLKCDKGDVYEANACGALGKLKQACATGEALCQENATTAKCQNIECRFTITETTLQGIVAKTAWLGENEVGVFGKEIYSQDAKGNKIPSKYKVGTNITMKPGESVCVQYQGPGENHYIYTCNNDGTVGRIESGALSAARDKICYYNDGVDAADERVNDYGKCKECRSHSNIATPGWLKSVLDVLGMEMLNAEWWDYWAGQGYCDDENSCLELGDCVKTDGNDCVPRYAPGKSDSCGECMDTMASDPFKKCPEKGCYSRGYCKWDSRTIDPVNTIVICGIETVTGNIMTSAISTLFKSVLGEEKTDMDKNKEVKDSKGKYDKALNILTLGLYGVLKKSSISLWNTMKSGINSLTTPESKKFFSDFFGWNRDDAKTIKREADSFNSEAKDLGTKLETSLKSKNAEMSYSPGDEKITVTINNQDKSTTTYTVAKDGTVKDSSGADVPKDKIPSEISSNQKDMKSFLTANSNYQKSTVEYDTKVNGIFDVKENEKIIIDQAIAQSSKKDGITITTKQYLNGYTSDGKEISQSIPANTKVTVVSNNGKYNIVSNVGDEERTLYNVEASTVRSMVKDSDLKYKAADTVMASGQKWRYSNYYGGAFYDPIRTKTVSEHKEVLNAAQDYIDAQGGWKDFLIKRFTQAGKSTIIGLAVQYVIQTLGIQEIAKMILGKFNPAYYIRMGICTGAQAIGYPYASCMNDKLGVPIFVCGIQTYANNGFNSKQNVCLPANVNDLSPYDGYDKCYLCNSDPNRACTQDRCYALSKQGSNGCEYDSATAGCKPNSEALKACDKNKGTKIEIKSIDNATKSGSTWSIKKINYSISEYSVVINTNKYSECKYSTEKSTNFDKMTSISEKGKRSEDGKKHEIALNIKSIDIKDTNFTYYLQCQDICVNASRTTLQEITLAKKEKPDEEGPLFDSSQQFPQPGELIEGDVSGKRNVLMKVITDEASICKYARYTIAEGPEGFAEGIKEYNTTANVMINAGKTEEEISLALQQLVKTNVTMNRDSTRKKHSDNLQGLENGKTYAFLVKCNDTAGNPSISNIVKFKVSEYVKVEIVKPTGSLDDPQPEIEAKTEKPTTCRYSLNPLTSFEEMTAFDDETGGLTHKAVFDNVLTYASHKIYVTCKDEVGNNIGKKDGGFTIIKDNKKPEVARAYFDSGTLTVVTSELAVCQHSSKSEFEAYGQGEDMVPSEPSLKHQADWAPGRSEPYYIICKDRAGNVMTRFVVNPYEIVSA